MLSVAQANLVVVEKVKHAVGRWPSNADLSAASRDDAEIVDIILTPEDPRVGDIGGVLVVTRNTGTIPWTFTDPYHAYRMGVGMGGTMSDGTAYNYKKDEPTVQIVNPVGELPGEFRGNRLTIDSGRAVVPDQTYTWLGRVCYNRAGSQTLVFQTVKENGTATGQRSKEPDGWFGQRVAIKITVDPLEK